MTLKQVEELLKEKDIDFSVCDAQKSVLWNWEKSEGGNGAFTAAKNGHRQWFKISKCPETVSLNKAECGRA